MVLKSNVLEPGGLRGLRLRSIPFMPQPYFGLDGGGVNFATRMYLVICMLRAYKCDVPRNERPTCTRVASLEPGVVYESTSLFIYWIAPGFSPTPRVFSSPHAPAPSQQSLS